MKFEENCPWGFRGEVVQKCERTDDGRQVITIAYLEPCSGELKRTNKGNNTLEETGSLLHTTSHFNISVIFQHARHSSSKDF